MWKTAPGQQSAGEPELEGTSFVAVPMTGVTSRSASAHTLKASAATRTNATMKSSFFQTVPTKRASLL